MVLAVSFSRRGWQYEWDWAFSNSSVSSVLLGPIAAGLVAFDRVHRFAPTLAELSRSTVRGRSAPFGLAVATWVWAVAAWAVGLLVVAAVVSMNDPAGWPDPWILLEVPCTLLATTFIGLLWGAKLT
ncbi:MAG: hypothetical protein ACRC0L_03575, partial [Angustibacter sp.]